MRPEGLGKFTVSRVMTKSVGYSRQIMHVPALGEVRCNMIPMTCWMDYIKLLS
jgi:hypothetical protein